MSHNIYFFSSLREKNKIVHSCKTFWNYIIWNKINLYSTLIQHYFYHQWRDEFLTCMTILLMKLVRCKEKSLHLFKKLATCLQSGLDICFRTSEEFFDQFGIIGWGWWWIALWCILSIIFICLWWASGWIFLVELVVIWSFEAFTFGHRIIRFVGHIFHNLNYVCYWMKLLHFYWIQWHNQTK